MCGILAVHGPIEILESQFELALKMQNHRGPDESRYIRYEDINFLLGTNRLSILDSANGSQPFQSQDKSISISFNGEIFNAQDLREKLKALGVSFNSSHSDTEVILNGYTLLGLDFLSELNGMFAIVIVDQQKGKVFGVRDRYGIKPFHFYFQEKVLMISSEIDPLMRCLRVVNSEPKLDQDSLREFLQIGFISAPRTIFRDIRVLQPGHLIEYDLESNSMKISKWWTESNKKWTETLEEDLPQLIRNEFLDTVKRWTYSDHPIALSLSGGLDSTCILIAASVLGIKLDTFSLVFEDPNLAQWDESENIRKISNHFSRNHKSIRLTADDFKQSIDGILKSLGQPYGGSIPTFKIFSEISKTHRVCLTGTGGDELFGNYGRLNLLSDLSFNSQPEFDENYTRVVYKSRVPLLERIFPEIDFTAEINAWWRNTIKDDGVGNEDRLARIDILGQLPDEFLLVTDRLSMKYSVEARTPFLDHIFAESVLSIRSQYRHALPYKNLLRQAFKPELDQLNFNWDKKGFSIPLSVWLRNDLKEWGEAAIKGPKLREFMKVNSGALFGVYQDFLAGDNQNILLLWKIMMLSAWLEQSDLDSEFKS